MWIRYYDASLPNENSQIIGIFVAFHDALTNTKTNPIRSHFASRTSCLMEDLRDFCVVVAAVVLALVQVTAPVWGFLVALIVVGFFGHFITNSRHCCNVVVPSGGGLAVAVKWQVRRRQPVQVQGRQPVLVRGRQPVRRRSELALNSRWRLAERGGESQRICRNESAGTAL